MFNGFNFAHPDGTTIIAILVAFVVATTVHEFCHAWTALMLGDDTAERLGRISLNPIVHFDPIGFLGMALIAIGGFGIGWGKPVPVNPSRLRWRQRGMAITALAGPVSNVVMAGLFILPLRFGHAAPPHLLDVFIRNFVFVNLLLAAFNLIPIPPLDGSKILAGILPNFWYPFLAPLERYGVVVLIVLIMLGGFGGGIGPSILSAMYSPVYNLLHSWIAGPVAL